MPTFAFPNAPKYLTVNLLRIWNAPLPLVPIARDKSIASVIYLMPDYYPCTVARLVSCYALFK